MKATMVLVYIAPDGKLLTHYQKVCPKYKAATGAYWPERLQHGATEYRLVHLEDENFRFSVSCYCCCKVYGRLRSEPGMIFERVLVRVVISALSEIYWSDTR